MDELTDPVYEALNRQRLLFASTRCSSATVVTATFMPASRLPVQRRSGVADLGRQSRGDRWSFAAGLSLLACTETSDDSGTNAV
jgi:hypothetical protein